MSLEFSNEKIKRLLSEEINLPSPPAIAVQILNTVKDEDSSLTDLEKIISADPALTGKLLRIANSSFYSLPKEVSNISRAMSILGTNVIKNIALSFVIAKDLQGDQDSTFDFDFFWRKSVTTAVSAELLKSIVGLKDDDIFVTGLLQDIGVLVLFLNKGHDYNTLLEGCRSDGEGTCLIEAEKLIYQFDHQQLSYSLIEDWGLPHSISVPIYFHHSSGEAPEEYRQTASILSIASLLSTIYNSTETSDNVFLLQTKMEELLGIKEDQTRQLLDEVAQKSIDILKIFEIDPGQMRPYSQMLQEANDELGRLNLSYELVVMKLKESKNQSEKFANKLREANKRLEELAFRDSLTSLYNHRYFQEIFETEVSRAARYNGDLSLIMFDIDFFKNVNDGYGHPAGDQVLMNLAKQILAVVRPSDIVARYGGEEFAVLLPQTKEPGMKVFAERLRQCVMDTCTTVHDNDIRVTISAGGCHFNAKNSKGYSKQDILDTADKALYASKNNGRNQVTIFPLQRI